MNINKILENLTPVEIVESYVFPVKLTAKQKKEADIQLKVSRLNSECEYTENDRHISRLLEVRFQIEDYINKNNFNPALTFSHFLFEYINIIGKKINDFAVEISIDETLLNQIISSDKTPPEYLAIRLELHSKNLIPAAYWFKLREIEIEHMLNTDIHLRKKEMKYVRSTIEVIV